MNQKLKNWCEKQRSFYNSGSLSPYKIKKLEEIDGWVWRVFDDAWDKNYNDLLKFAHKNNHIPVSTKSKLGVWCNTQRNCYNLNKLSKHKLDLLESIDCWYWDWHEYTWNNNFKKLYEYTNIQNNPVPYQGDDIFGNFISVQRTRYAQNKMPKYQIELMESINGWFWSKNDIWDKKYKSLHQYVNIENNPIPAQSHKKLGVWVSDQRELYRTNNLSNDRIQLLEAINDWYWNNNDEIVKRWYTVANKLKLVKNVSDIKLSHKTFGAWINNQRSKYKEGVLAQYKIDFLESIDGWVWYIDLDSQWKYMAYSLTYENHNKGDNKNWCDRQRYRYNKGIMEQERIDILNSFDWWYWETPTDHIWEKKYNEVINYTSEDVSIKFRYWIMTQRSNYKKNKLTPIKIKKLEAIKWWQWKELEENWECTAKELKVYMVGKSKLPKTNHPLYGNWVRRQKYTYNNGNLSEHRIKVLESITGWSWGKNNS